MTGYIYTFSSFLLHIHRGSALLLPSRASWVFRTFNALPLPTKSHGGSPIICLCPGAFAIPGRQTCMVVHPLICPCPAGPNTAQPFSALFRLDAGHVYCSWVLRCILLLRTGDASGPGASSHMMFFSSGSSCPEPLCVLQPCSGHDVLLPATSWPH